MQLSPSRGVLSFTPKTHTNLHLQIVPAPEPFPALAPASSSAPVVPMGMGIWDARLDGRVALISLGRKQSNFQLGLMTSE